MENKKEHYFKISKQISVTYFFNILIFLSQLLLISLLTKTLTVKEYGIYSLLIALIGTLSFTLVLGLNVFVPTKFPGAEYKKKITALFSVLFFEIILLVITSTLLLVPPIQKSLLSLLKMEGYQSEFQLSIFILFMTTLFIILSSYLSAERKIEFQSFMSFFDKSLWVILLALFLLVFKTFNLTIVLSLWSIGVLFSSVVILIYLRKEIIFFFTKVKRINKKLYKRALVFGLPLVPVAICSWFIEISDRYLINHFQDAFFVGIYSLSYGLVSIILGLSGIIYSVFYPYIAKAWNDKTNHQIYFNALLKYTLVIVIPAMTGLFVLRKQIILLISGSKYLMGVSALEILIFFPLFASLVGIYTNDLQLRNKTSLLAVIYLGGAILNIVLNLFLIPLYGIKGAAMTTVIAYIFILFVLHLISKRKFVWNFRFLRITRIILASLLMGGILFLINPQVFITKILSIIFGALIYILLLFLLRVFIKEEYDIMKSFIPKFLHVFFKSFK